MHGHGASRRRRRRFALATDGHTANLDPQVVRDRLTESGVIPPELVHAMATTGRTVIAGCLTPTEILSATNAGAHAIKIFPANAVAPSYLAALHGPFPHLQLIPTGAIEPPTHNHGFKPAPSRSASADSSHDPSIPMTTS